MAAAPCPLADGTAVRVFYHASHHPQGYRYCRLLEASANEEGIVIGLSTGWVPATVAGGWDPKEAADAEAEGREARVLVLLHGRFADAYHHDTGVGGEEVVTDMYWRVRRALVRTVDMEQPIAEVSLLVVRWWDYHNKKHRISRSHNVANEGLILDALEEMGSPYANLGDEGRYDVHSAFIRKGTDLRLVDKSVACALRGQRRVAYYFLWPTQKPATERRMPGAVAEPALFDVMSRMEQEGIRTVWPHESQFYRELAGKLWPARVSRQRPDLRVPATVRIDMQRWASDPVSAARDAIAALEDIRVGRVRRCRVERGAGFRGVAKLGYSWMGQEVRAFQGQDSLLKVLMQLLDGASPNVVCLVQERIEDVVCEVRFICCRDLASGSKSVKKEVVRMKLHPPRQGDFSLTSHEVMSADEAARCVFGGGRVGANIGRAVEADAGQLADLWLQWFQDEGYGLPSVCRLDFLVSWSNGQSHADVWTVELCECGGSLCGFTASRRTAAIFNACLAEEDGSLNPAGPQPIPLPPMCVNSWAGHDRAANQGGWAEQGWVSRAREQQSQTGRVKACQEVRKRSILCFIDQLPAPSNLLRAIFAALVMLWLSRFRRKHHLGI